MYTGPKTINEQMIFGYDTAHGVADNHTATRFYPGEPTFNYANPNSVSQGGWGGSIRSGQTDQANGEFDLRVSNFNGNPGAGWRSFTWNMNSHSGSAVTISATVEIPDDSPGDFAWVMAGGTTTATYLGYSSSSERYQKSTKGTERISWSGTIGSTGTNYQPSGHIGFTVWYNDGIPNSNSYITVKDVQIEKNSHATPFHRQGFVRDTLNEGNPFPSLLRLDTTLNDVNVDDVSFNATGQPTFDGTDDYIVTNLTRGDLGDSFTIIAYYKYTGSSSRGYTPIFGGHESGGGGTEFFIGKDTGNTNIGVQDGNYSGSFVTGSNAWDGNYHQIVYTYQLIGSSSSTNGTGKIYLDGVLKTAGSFTKCNTGENIRIGNEADGSGYRFLGDIPRACIYKRAFTAGDDLEDFNTHKNRFNI